MRYPFGIALSLFLLFTSVPSSARAATLLTVDAMAPAPLCLATGGVKSTESIWPFPTPDPENDCCDDCSSLQQYCYQSCNRKGALNPDYDIESCKNDCDTNCTNCVGTCGGCDTCQYL